MHTGTFKKHFNLKLLFQKLKNIKIFTMPKKSEIKKEEKIKDIKKSKISKKITQEEFEKKIIDLAKKGLSSEKIGEELRQQSIHPKEYKKKISQVLRENNIYINPDMKNIEIKLEKVKNHYEKNKQDKRAMREKDRIFAQLRKLRMYYNKG